jgi:tetratricopeptide (TPR) repeat protein
MATWDEALAAYKAGALYEVRTICGRCLAGQPALEMRVQVLHLDGVCAREIGDVLEALDRFAEADRFLVELPSLRPVMAGKLAYNRALAYWQRGQRFEALSEYRTAMVEFRRQGQMNAWRQAAHNAAWVLIEEGRLEEAELLLDQASPPAEVPSEFTVAQQILTAMIGIRRGNPSQALHDLAIMLEQNCVSTSMKVWAAAVGGEAALAEGNLPMAHVLAGRAVELSQGVVDSRTHRVAHQVYHLVQQADYARRQDHEWSCRPRLHQTNWKGSVEDAFTASADPDVGRPIPRSVGQPSVGRATWFHHRANPYYRLQDVVALVKALR